MYKLFLLIGTTASALSVAIGAFGAHALKDLLKANGRGDVFETAVKYQFYHSFALLFIGVLLLLKGDNKMLEWAGWAFATGIIVFSGSLYILALTNVGKWGAVTPIGGTLFIAGWIMALVAVLKF
jgi:uncharacterized membrane protein YgdD (TMEM256/DUF423 family)